MADWGPVFVAVMLFILLTPGLLIQIPGHTKVVEFGNFQRVVSRFWFIPSSILLLCASSC
ncbi:hypothetical protein HanOQP8_Chr14g0540381 [Helianthus annuus]|nr:hypothetical protein HanOQP8_Chr14g0540381 [Helianthus annuus]